MTTSQLQAREYSLAIRRAMLILGRPATAVEIAAIAALPLQVVARRLQGNGTSNLDNRFAWFAKGEAGWGLTTRGREEP